MILQENSNVTKEVLINKCINFAETVKAVNRIQREDIYFSNGSSY